MDNKTSKSHKGLKKGLYLIPTSFTAANIGMGFLAVLASLKGFQLAGINGADAAVYFDYAAKAIGLAILFDTLDGRLARMTKTSTELGVQLDSLADVLTFGIAPVVLVYGWGIAPTLAEGTFLHNLGVLLLFTFLMCGVLRLARFNLQATRPRVLKEGKTKVDKKSFVGLPIPPAAGLLAAIVHFTPLPLNTYGEVAGESYATLMMILLPILGGLMISTIRYSSFKNTASGKNNFQLVLLLGAIGMLIWLYSRYALLLLALVYVSHGVIFYLFKLFSGKKTVENETSQEPEIDAG
ncbi:MAG: CDP-alcohol phosphatidyltransferase family protein [Pyrinomonadaceae bacterium]